jgi:hypothetical protein
MKDKLPLIAIIGMVLLFIGSMTAVILIQNSSTTKKTATIAAEIATTQKKVDEITASKDTNNLTPTEVVTFFLTEVKSDSTDKAKLYLSSAVQEMDIKNTLKLGTDLSNMTVGESEQTIASEEATVVINLQVASDQVARTFSLEKVEGAWKIKGILAE